MKIVEVDYAKTHLSQLLKQVANGDEVIIGKSGEPIARLIPFTRSTSPRKPGQWKGKVKIAKDFDKFPDDLLEAFGDRSK